MRQLPKHIQQPDPGLYRVGTYLVLDFETTSDRRGLAHYPDNHVVMAAWLGRTGMRQHFGNEYEQQKLYNAIQEVDFIVAHNAKFELQWLARMGVDLTQIVVWDTMIGDYVLGGNRWVGADLSLDACVQRRGWPSKVNLVSKLIKGGVPVHEIPSRWLGDYCVRDVELTAKLFRDQIEQMNDKQLATQYTRCLLTPVLADIEMNGMTLDIQRVSDRLTQLENMHEQCEQDLESMTGGINTKSGQQLSEFLYDKLGFAEVKRFGKPARTTSGQRKTDQLTLSMLNARTKKQREFLETYLHSKAVWNELTKYLRKFADCCIDNDGKMLAQFNQTFTQTHRLSSRGLDYTTQFQNFPRAYKPMFKASQPDWVIGEADSSQLEFRVAAHLGRDVVAIQDIVSGTDVHTITAQKITEAGQPTTRQEAKAHTFKPLYGGSSGTPAEQEYYKWFKENYKGIAETQQRWIDTVLLEKKLTTETGLTFYWPDTRMDRSGYIKNTTSICNYPVQSLATAEIIPIAVVYFWHRYKAHGYNMRLLSTIHDSIVVEMPPEEVQAFNVLCKQALCDDPFAYLRQVYEVGFTVPLSCGVKVGSHWGESDVQQEVVFTCK